MAPISNLDYFKVIEEQIKENTMVTFKWLSRKLKVHNTIAKELLQEFLLNVENESKYVVTFVLYGKKNDGNLVLSLIEKKDLTAGLNEDISVMDQHIYSIQLTDSKFNPDTIYNIDKATYELQQLNLSSIRFNKEVTRENVAGQPVSNVVSDSQKSAPHDRKAEGKKQASPAKEYIVGGHQNEMNEKNVTKKANITKSMISSKGSISSFFQKQVAKGTNAVNSSDATNTSNLSSRSNDSLVRNNNIDGRDETNDSASKLESIKEEKFTNLEAPLREISKCGTTEKPLCTGSVAEKTEQNLNSSKNSQNISKNTSKVKKSKSKKTCKQKKMKRIILQSDSSSNSEDESHISEPEFEEEPEPVAEPPKKELPAVIIAHGKKRKRKIVEKTFTDGDGFLHTSKEVVYESCSSDEENSAVSNDENVDSNKRLKIDESAENVDCEKISNIQEINKIRKQKTKQSSIMSFFKKPSKT